MKIRETIEMLVFLAIILACIAFPLLKLTGFITWSWLWVTSPYWMPPVLFIIIFTAWSVLEMRKECINHRAQ